MKFIHPSIITVVPVLFIVFHATLSLSFSWCATTRKQLLTKVSRTSTQRFSASNNQLYDRSSLDNDYFCLRHGQSMANVAKIIASSPDIATKKYGLSPVGKEQAAKAGDDIVRQFRNSQPEGILLLSSDLLRAKETAMIVRDSVLAESDIPLKKDDVVIETRLRERWFGKWDLGPDSNYEEVWKDDALDSTHEIKGVESVESVIKRVTQCIIEWDSKVQDHMIICVAHGDVLQILQTAFMKKDGTQHRELEHLETATLRSLKLRHSM